MSALGAFIPGPFCFVSKRMIHSINSVNLYILQNMHIDSEQFATYPELFYLGLDITLREVLYVGQLEIHLSQPNQDAVSGCLKLLSLADEVLREQRET